MEVDQRVLSETEQRVQAEMQAKAALEECEIAERRAREATQAREASANKDMLTALKADIVSKFSIIFLYDIMRFLHLN